MSYVVGCREGGIESGITAQFEFQTYSSSTAIPRTSIRTQGNNGGATLLVLLVLVRTSFMKPLAFIPTGVSFATASLNMSPGIISYRAEGRQKGKETPDSKHLKAGAQRSIYVPWGTLRVRTTSMIVIKQSVPPWRCTSDLCEREYEYVHT